MKWSYRKSIVISNTVGALTDYQVRLTIDTSSLISASKMQASGQDIRFTDSSGNGLFLNYWIEPGTINTASTIIWVKIPSLSTGLNTIYIYYGNSLSPAASNTDAFIREIDGGSIAGTTKGLWHIDESSGNSVFDSSGSVNTLTQANTTIISGKTGFGNARNLTGAVNSTIMGAVAGLPVGSSARTMMCWFRTSDSTARLRTIIGYGANAANVLYTIYLNSTNHLVGEIGGGVIAVTSPGTYNDGAWHHVSLTLTGANGTLTMLVDGASVGTPVLNVTAATGSSNLGIGVFPSSLTMNWIGDVDDGILLSNVLNSAEILDIVNNYCYITSNYPNKILVRKFSSSEPSHSSTGTEEPTPSQSILSSTFLTGWGNRKRINIDAPFTRTLYQIKVTIHKGIGVDSSTDIYITNSNNDFSDIRFTNSNGTTLLDYWIQSKVDGNNAVVWVEVDSLIPNTNNTNIYLYYNNPSASSQSSSVNTFMFFDDFSAGLNKWNVSVNVSIVGGKLYIPPGVPPNDGYAIFKTVIPKPCTVEYDAQLTTATHAWDEIIALTTRSTPYIVFGAQPTVGYFYENLGTDSKYAMLGISCPANLICQTTIVNMGAKDIALHNYKINWGNKISESHLFSDLTDFIPTTAFPNANTSLYFGASGNNQQNNDGIKLGNFRVRNYSSPEPIFESIEIEEVPSSPILGTIFTSIGRGITPMIGIICGKKRLRNR